MTVEAIWVKWTHCHVQETSLRWFELCDMVHYSAGSTSEDGYTVVIKGRTWSTMSRNLATVVVRGVLPGLRRRTGLLPSDPKSFSDESKFCISFGNQGPRVWRKGGEAHSSSCLKSSVKFPQSVMIWGAMTSAGVGPLCFFENQRHCTRLPRNFGALHASFCWPAF